MTELAERYLDLRKAIPYLRARDAAERLGSTEAALVASGALGDVVPLLPDWPGLVGSFRTLKRGMALTRNEHAVHERHGSYLDVSSTAGHILVLGPDIDLRLFPGDWGSAYALGGERPSIQVFARDGSAVHKVYAVEGTDRAAWEALVAERLLANAPLPPAVPAVPAPIVPEPVPEEHRLRRDWLALQDTHDFVALLRAHNASRRMAFRVAGDDLARQLDPRAGAAVLRLAAERAVPVMVFVGNRHAIQIHSGPVTRLADIGGWFNVLDPDFNLHLREAGIAQAWRVVKPTADGAVTSIELLDEAGLPVMLVFGVRKPGRPELEEWRGIAGEVAERHSLSEAAA